MAVPAAASPRLVAVSDLHIGYGANRQVVQGLRPRHPGDWLIVAGDVCEKVADLQWALGTLAERFERVVWTPGNHELWTHPNDPVQLRGVERYEHLVEVCRALGVLTPEDPFALWDGPGGQAAVAPLFVLYDYSWTAPGTTTKAQSLAAAAASGFLARDEELLHPDPFATREDWCRARVAETSRRLAAVPEGVPLVLASHWPLHRAATRPLRYPAFAQWCGTDLTSEWHVRFPVAVAVYGHLHIPRTFVLDGVPFVEVSLGYPRQWQARGDHEYEPHQVLPRA